MRLSMNVAGREYCVSYGLHEMWINRARYELVHKKSPESVRGDVFRASEFYDGT